MSLRGLKGLRKSLKAALSSPKREDHLEDDTPHSQKRGLADEMYQSYVRKGQDFVKRTCPNYYKQLGLPMVSNAEVIQQELDRRIREATSRGGTGEQMGKKLLMIRRVFDPSFRVMYDEMLSLSKMFLRAVQHADTPSIQAISLRAQHIAQEFSVAASAGQIPDPVRRFSTGLATLCLEGVGVLEMLMNVGGEDEVEDRVMCPPAATITQGKEPDELVVLVLNPEFAEGVLEALSSIPRYKWNRPLTKPHRVSGGLPDDYTMQYYINSKYLDEVVSVLRGSNVPLLNVPIHEFITAFYGRSNRAKDKSEDPVLILNAQQSHSIPAENNSRSTARSKLVPEGISSKPFSVTPASPANTLHNRPGETGSAEALAGANDVVAVNESSGNDSTQHPGETKEAEGTAVPKTPEEWRKLIEDEFREELESERDAWRSVVDELRKNVSDLQAANEASHRESRRLEIERDDLQARLRLQAEGESLSTMFSEEQSPDALLLKRLAAKEQELSHIRSENLNLREENVRLSKELEVILQRMGQMAIRQTHSPIISPRIHSPVPPALLNLTDTNAGNAPASSFVLARNNTTEENMTSTTTGDVDDDDDDELGASGDGLLKDWVESDSRGGSFSSCDSPTVIPSVLFVNRSQKPHSTHANTISSKPVLPLSPPQATTVSSKPVVPASPPRATSSGDGTFVDPARQLSSSGVPSVPTSVSGNLRQAAGSGDSPTPEVVRRKSSRGGLSPSPPAAVELLDPACSPPAATRGTPSSPTTPAVLATSSYLGMVDVDSDCSPSPGSIPGSDGAVSPAANGPTHGVTSPAAARELGSVSNSNGSGGDDSNGGGDGSGGGSNGAGSGGSARSPEPLRTKDGGRTPTRRLTRSVTPEFPSSPTRRTRQEAPTTRPRPQSASSVRFSPTRRSPPSATTSISRGQATFATTAVPKPRRPASATKATTASTAAATTTTTASPASITIDSTRTTPTSASVRTTARTGPTGSAVKRGGSGGRPSFSAVIAASGGRGFRRPQ
eukprot:Rmarinus@m.14125